MSNILGGFIGTLWHSSGYNDNSLAYNIGVITRFNPVLDPGNIRGRGTGERGLYDILLGMRRPRINIDLIPAKGDNNDDGIFWLNSIQNGQAAVAYLHLRFVGGEGLTFENAFANRVSVESRHPDPIEASIEMWSGGGASFPVGVRDWEGTPPTQNWQTRSITPYRWLESSLDIGLVTETAWWSWRYEVLNNLQRLGNVASGGTRDIVARHRDVSGLIVKDLADFDEYKDLADISADAAKFNLTMDVATAGCTPTTTELLNCDYCRWGVLEAPSGPEDLIAKRFPFVAADLTTFTP